MPDRLGVALDDALDVAIGIALQRLELDDEMRAQSKRIRAEYYEGPQRFVNKEREKNMLHLLKAFDKDRVDLDEAVALLAFGNTVASTYASTNLETPDWLTETLASITKEVAARRRDNIEKERKTTLAKLETLKTNEEKRSELQAKLDRLNQTLAGA